MIHTNIYILSALAFFLILILIDFVFLNFFGAFVNFSPPLSVLNISDTVAERFKPTFLILPSSTISSIIVNGDDVCFPIMDISNEALRVLPLTVVGLIVTGLKRLTNFNLILCLLAIFLNNFFFRTTVFGVPSAPNATKLTFLEAAAIGVLPM